MALVYLYAFLSVAVVSLVSLIGVFFLSFREMFIRKYIFIFISLAVGALLGDAFIHLIPESFEVLHPTSASILIILGILIFFVFEKVLHWHHHGEDKGETHLHPVGKLILFSDGVHNLIDGIVIGVSFFISVPVGIATTIAVILHEIPQEVGDFMVLLHSGYSKRRALWLNFFSALTAFVGLIIAFIIKESSDFIVWVIPITAGGFIYIAVADLIPELHKAKDIKPLIPQVIALVLGVAVMLALLYVS